MYELWDSESRNRIDEFATEREALAAAALLIARNPRVYPRGLTLLRWVDDDYEDVAAGNKLVALIEAHRIPA